MTRSRSLVLTPLFLSMPGSERAEMGSLHREASEEMLDICRGILTS